MLAIALMISVAGIGTAHDTREQAWALGYTSFVRYTCPAWDQRIDALPAEILPSSSSWNKEWARNGRLAVAHRQGLQAARKSHRVDRSFCEHPTRGSGIRTSLLNQILIRR